ncbi:molybdopterin converting factor [Thermus parvatiensis]|uniref:Molybdopterin converting factor n=1 Tax=Thermus parvatiensis TaxID=456163 RepID=H7GDY8_9DEIN|nr:ubiquitin-like small modifier protein 1 [Thermus parvatiensis]AMA76171.1 molybdopterin converting factor [Thermus parvatiensis]EIA39930.1 molybdopterin converting factor subunit 1 moaD [Thermus parvatiensis]
MPKVNLYATFRDLTGTSQLQVEGRTVGEVLANLVRRYPQMREELFEGEALAERVSVFLEGRDVRYLQGLSTPLAPEATLDLFPPVAGGGLEGRFGALPPWLLEHYLTEWGGRKLADGTYTLPGARVRFREVEPLKVGSLSIPQLFVEVEGEEAEKWFERIALAASRGGG